MVNLTPSKSVWRQTKDTSKEVYKDNLLITLQFDVPSNTTDLTIIALDSEHNPIMDVDILHHIVEADIMEGIQKS